jgi:Ca2+-binding EF-hand superfamily protein
MFALGFQPTSLAGDGGSKRRGSLLNAISENGQAITLEEFTLLMKGELIGNSPLEGIWSAFTTLSQDCQNAAGLVQVSGEEEGWGFVTLNGLRRACREYDVRLTEEELVCMMEDVDADGDGTVDKEEFLNIMRHAPWF